MKIDLNDPRLTAYALGELAEDERELFAAALADDPVARREVETIRRAAGELREQLAAEPCPRLEPEHRAAIYDRVEGRRGAGRGHQPWWGGSLARAMALIVTVHVVVLGGIWIFVVFRSATQSSPQLAQKETTTAYFLEERLPGPALVPSSDGLPVAMQPAAPLSQAEQTEALPQLETVAAAAPSTADIVAESTSSPAESPMAAPSSQSVAPAARLQAPVPTIAPPVTKPQMVAAARPAPAPQSSRPLGLRREASRIAAAPPQPSEAQIETDLAPLSVLAEEARIEVKSQPLSPRPERTVVTRSDTTIMSRGPAVYVSEVEIQASSRHPVEASAVHDQGWNGGSLYSTPASISTESYTHLADNPFRAVTDQPLSTFGLDVDTASYSNIRRFLLNHRRPPRDAVRIEEMLNYFNYDYPAPRGSEPFALYAEMGECPWNPGHQLALIGLRARDITPRQQPPLNLVFLIDVSGSMASANKLALIKQSFRLLVPQLDRRDRVAIVVYANNSRVVLPSTRGDQHRRILSVIEELHANGGTNGGAGIQQAYDQASNNFIKGGVNRVILCTDGDFNVGITDQNALVGLIEDKARSGVFLNVFGFGMGNLKDATMQRLANRGNGHYAYLDNIKEARKVLVDQARSTIITVAKDVKLQVEFNPAQVHSYRLIGYEKRQLAARDFNDDRKDAGEIGAGHTVTALYEIVPAGNRSGEPGVDPLKYQPEKNRPVVDGEWATVKLRYKEPEANRSELRTVALENSGRRWQTASDDFQFASAVAAFGMILRDSPYKANSNLDLTLELARAGRGRDVKGYRQEFVDLVDRARGTARNFPADF